MTNFSSNTGGTPAVGATGADGADGIDVNVTGTGTGVAIFTESGTAVNALSQSGAAIAALSETANGVLAWSEDVAAIYAWNGPKNLDNLQDYPQDAAVHAFSAGTVASTSTAIQAGPSFPTAMFAEGGLGYGLIATAGPSEAQLTSDYPDPADWSDIGVAIRAENFYGTAIQANGYFAPAINVTIGKLVGPPPPPGVTPPPPAVCIEAFNNYPQLAISAVTEDAGGNASDCIRGVTSYGAGVNGQSQYGTGVMGTTTSADGIGVTADGGTSSGTPIGAVALKVQNGTIAVTSDSAGTTILHHGTKTVTVSNPAATPDSLIFLTPQEDPQGFLWISAHTAGSFTIKASTAPSADVTIGFLIIN